MGNEKWERTKTIKGERRKGKGERGKEKGERQKEKRLSAWNDQSGKSLSYCC